MAKMKQDTPYRTRPATERERERSCVEDILLKASPVNRVYEAFGGIGMLGEVIAQRFPKARIDAYELDEECVQQYLSRGLRNTRVHRADTLTAAGEFDAASLDFNRSTLLDLGRREGEFQQVLCDRVFKQHPAWVHITDSSCSKLHLNWRSYGLSGPDWGEYVEALGAAILYRRNYRILTWSKHSRAAYFLFIPSA